MLRTLIALIAVFTLLAPGRLIADFHVEPELLANVNSITPGKSFLIGLHLKIAPGWHTYWKNPGDAGLPITLQWNLPPGWKAGELQWPIPLKFEEENPDGGPGFTTYGYEDEVLVMEQLTPPTSITGNVQLQANARWLVCKQSCVPGSDTLTLSLPVGQNSAAANAELFAKFRALLPTPGAPPFQASYVLSGAGLQLETGIPSGQHIDFYPGDSTLGNAKAIAPNILQIPFNGPTPAKPVLSGLLLLEGSNTRQGWEVQTSVQSEPASLGTIQPRLGGGAASKPRPGLTLWKALGFGLIGGFILNLMPCVLPVIALKIFGFIGQVGESRSRVFRVGLAFVAGIFAWFMALAALIVLARRAGHHVTWAFQFQNPDFVLGMALLVFVFALNLLGVFELWLPGTSKLVSLSEKEGYAGAFLHGAFATLLATPCTAPFLGPALAFAFAQRAPVTFAMFGSIAAGMSTPYLLLTWQPGWMRFLPKPGDWMVRLKQVMGFLLLGTVVWLFGVLASLKGATGASGATWLLLGLGAACWIFGVWIRPGSKLTHNLVAWGAIVGVMVLAFGLGHPSMVEKSAWQPWSPKRVADLQQQGRAVFVDFTADWCLNCKYNERFVLDTDPVRKALQNVVKLRADWTKGDPEITAELKKIGRAGVPAYVIYPAKGGNPKVLPEILTQKTVLAALNEAK